MSNIQMQSEKTTDLVKASVPPAKMIGEEPGDFQQSEARLIQPTSSGNFIPGSLIEFPGEEVLHKAKAPFEPWTLEGIIPLALISYYRAFDDDGSLAYTRKPLEWVEQHHPDDLEPGSGRDGQGERAQRIITAIVLSPHRDGPWALSFVGKLQLRAARKLNGFESARRRRGQNSGVYTLKCTDFKTQFGSTVFTWEIQKPIGEIPDEDLDRVGEHAADVREAIATRGVRDEATPEPATTEPATTAVDDLPF